MNSFRAVIFNLITLPIAFIMGTLGILLIPVPYRYRYPIVMQFNRFALLALKLCCGVGCTVKGSENISQDTPVVVMSKHQSTWETFFLQLHFAPISTVLKRELLRIPGFGWGLALMRPIAIDRSNPREALRKVKSMGMQRISEGSNVLIFPEGTRVKAGEVGNYARSGADIAISAGVPVIAVAHNAGVYWPKGQLSKNSGTISIAISEPFSSEGKNSKQLTQEVKDWIEGEISQMPQTP